MIKKRYLILTLIIVLLFIHSISFASNLYLGNKEVDFNIKPKKITESTYLPVEQFIDKIALEIDELKNDRYIIFYNNNFYLLSTNSTLVKTSEGNFDLVNKPILINDHLLIPIKFFTDVLNLDLRISNQESPIDIYNGNIQANIYVNNNILEDDDVLKLSIELINPTDKDIILRFNTSQKYEILINNIYGDTVYTWSKDKMFSQVFTELKIEAKDTINFKENINILKFQKGVYFIKAIIESEELVIETEPKNIIIKE